MKLLFIGGTGRISASVTQLCLSQGHEVYLLNRGQHAPLPAGAIHLRADINDEAQVTALLKGHRFDAVANFINYTPDEVARDLRLFAGNTDQYVFISSASAYQKPAAHYVISESTPLANPHWPYSRDKIACEELLMQAYRSHGFPVTIVRPSHTYDKTAVPVALHGGKGAWQVLKRMQAGRPVLVHGDGTSLWVVTHSADFAKGFAGLLGNVHAIGEAVHITSDEVLTWNTIYACIGRAMGVAPQICYVPTAQLGAADPTQEGPLWGDKAHATVFDNAKIKRLVPDYCAAVRFDQGVRASVAHLLATPALQREDAAFDGFCDAMVEKWKV